MQRICVTIATTELVNLRWPICVSIQTDLTIPAEFAKIATLQNIILREKQNEPKRISKPKMMNKVKISRDKGLIPIE